jgi:hypothetical protein
MLLPSHMQWRIGEMILPSFILLQNTVLLVLYHSKELVAGIGQERLYSLAC